MACYAASARIPVYAAASALPLDNSFDAYAFRVAHHKVVTHYRELARRPLMRLDHPTPGTEGSDATAEIEDEAPQPIDEVLAGEAEREAFTWLNRAVTTSGLLTPRERECIRARYLVGASVEEVANDLGIRRETVKSTLADALRKLRHAAFRPYLHTLTVEQGRLFERYFGERASIQDIARERLDAVESDGTWSDDTRRPACDAVAAELEVIRSRLVAEIGAKGLVWHDEEDL